MDVTVIITAHKNRGYLDQCIKSVLKQRFWGSMEVILASDDCDELKEYAKKYKIKYTQTKKRMGFSSNFNLASKFAEGRYLKIVADDDLLPQGAIQALYNGISGSDHALIHANATNFRATKTTLKYKPPFKTPTTEQILEKNPIHGGTIMVDAEVFDEIGMYDTSLAYCEEYELYLRLLSLGYTFTYIDKFVYLYREHSEQKGNPRNKDKQNTAQYIKNKYGIQNKN